jgi:hypothetical protein
MKALTRQKGSAPVELIVVVMCVLTMLAMLVFFGRLFWYYGVLKSASVHGARIVAAAPPYTFANTASRNALLQMARQETENAAIASGLISGEVAGSASIECDGGDCRWPVPPQRVRAQFRVAFTDPFLPNFTGAYMPMGVYFLDIGTEVAYSAKLPVEASVTP